MGMAQVVVGGQFGSEAKGHVAAYLAKNRPRKRQFIAVRVAGPNAGHTAYDEQGRKWALRQIPVMAVVDMECKLVIAAGSEIDPEVLASEISALENAGIPIISRLTIDRSATIVEPKHYETESLLGLVAKAGSTGKGVGAARADRLLRGAKTWGMAGFGPISHTAGMLNDPGVDVILEGTQGYGLGLHAGYYPHCTSSDCRVSDFLAMAGIAVPSVHDIMPWVVLRTYPIRIAGNSGPMVDEKDWSDLTEQSGGHIQPEFTTVTKKLRRIGGWDPILSQQAVAANGGPRVSIALMFFDYWFPELAEKTAQRILTDEHWSRIKDVEAQVGSHILLLGTGPNSMIDLTR